MELFVTKKSFAESGIFRGFTDCHCHILPGVDDGFKTVEDSLAALRMYEEAGVSNVILTPHVMEDMPNSPADLEVAFEAFKAAYDGPVNLLLGAENMLDSLFEERLKSNDLISLPGSKLLVETSYFTPPYGMRETLNRIKSRGYFPILAHPERYVYMEKSDYEELKEMGILFQLNLTSLAGFYGRTAYAKAAMMLKKGWYDLCGTDLHRGRVFEKMLSERVPSKLLRLASELHFDLQ